MVTQLRMNGLDRQVGWTESEWKINFREAPNK